MDIMLVQGRATCQRPPDRAAPSESTGAASPASASVAKVRMIIAWTFPSSCSGGSGRGRAEAGDFQDLALVERLGLQERGGERDQLVAVLGEKTGRFALALLDDAPYLGVDQLGGHLAVGLALEGRREAVVLRGDEADWAELRTHSPAQHHLTGDLGDLPEVV